MNLVFASGFLVPQYVLGIEYFRGLKAHIESLHRHQAFFPPVPPVGTYEHRATSLAQAIQKAYPDGPAHIIAHSMGGLDSRALLGHNMQGLSNPGRVASLTMISTPHCGSPVADLLVQPEPGLPGFVYDGLENAIRRLGVDAGVLANLTTEEASKVPDPAQIHRHIHSRSYVAWGRPGIRPTCFALSLSHHYIHAVTGQANDGLVALASARYGEFQQSFWQCDHADAVGHNLDPGDLGGFQFDHLAAFDALINGLPAPGG